MQARHATIRKSFKKKPPSFIPPQLAKLSENIPQGSGWIFEPKFDGYRILGRISNGRVTLYSRNGNDWTKQFKTIADSLEKRCSRLEAVLDGEVVAVTKGALSPFQALQNHLNSGSRYKLRYHLFDLLWLNGHDLRELPLRSRKELLFEALFASLPRDPYLSFVKHRTRGAEKLLQSACERHEEGIICKRIDAGYLSGRSGLWIKVKCSGNDEFVVGGFTKLREHDPSVGALLLGQYHGKRFEYCGRVGTGFSSRDRQVLYKALKKLRRVRPSFVNPPQGRDIMWTEPKLVAQVAYTEKTTDGLLRHPSFLGLRKDKAAREIRSGKA